MLQLIAYLPEVIQHVTECRASVSGRVRCLYRAQKVGPVQSAFTFSLQDREPSAVVLFSGWLASCCQLLPGIRSSSCLWRQLVHSSSKESTYSSPRLEAALFALSPVQLLHSSRFCQDSLHVSSQGPIAGVRISEVSLGHTRNASKVAEAALSWRFRLPFTIRDLAIDLRPPGAHSSAKADKVSLTTNTSKANTPTASHKALLNTGLRLLLGILPNIPIRIKQLTVKQVSSNLGVMFPCTTASLMPWATSHRVLANPYLS